ncbi:hypothetical protein [Variovorax sp. YR566]|uniref:hypothetical protein n=1 Tax=Variovorax sp. YR566 TaxID=3450237 RepID=UPI003F7E4D30
MDERRNFVRLLGGGVVVAAGAAALAAWWLNSDMPAAALEVWNGPGNEPDVRKRAVAYAVTAPTAYNCQPWLVDLREPDAIVVYCDRERVQPESDPFGRQVVIGHGAFIELLVMALAQQGVQASVQLWPQGELIGEPRHWPHIPVARLRLADGGVPDSLFAQVLRRRTPKQRFDLTRPVSADMLQGLTSVVPVGGMVSSAGTVEMARVLPLRRLCAAAARVELATPGTAMENLQLLRIGPQEILEHRDGFSVNDPALRIAVALGQFSRSTPAPEDSPLVPPGPADVRGPGPNRDGLRLAQHARQQPHRADCGGPRPRAPAAARHRPGPGHAPDEPAARRVRGDGAVPCGRARPAAGHRAAGRQAQPDGADDVPPRLPDGAGARRAAPAARRLHDGLKA